MMLAVVAALPACSEGEVLLPERSAGDGPVVAVELTPEEVTLTPPGDEALLRAVAIDSDGDTIEAASDAFRWSSSDTAVVAVDSMGTLRAGEEGAALVSAELDGKEDTADVTVAGSPPPEDDSESTAITCGQVVTESIVLSNDLEDCAGPGIVVGADDIVIDGRGHTVDGQGSDYGVKIEQQDRVTVKNLRVTDFGRGIYIFQSGGGQVVENDLLSNGEGVSLRSGTNGYVVRGNRTGSINLHGRGNTISNNEISGGIYMPLAMENEVLNNSISGGPGSSIHLTSSSDNRIEGNQVTGGGDEGAIRLTDSHQNRISGNEVSGADGPGIWITYSTGNELLNNRSSQNTGDGFRVSRESGGNRIADNLSQDNGGFGFLDVSSPLPGRPADVYEQNACSGNRDGPSSPEGLCGTADGDGP